MKIIKPTDDEAAMFSLERDGHPNWPDGCEHSKEPGTTFMGTFNVANFQKKTVEKYDLYVFVNGDRTEVCIRFGPEGGDYISPGNLGEFLLRTDHTKEVYYRAAQIILHYGYVGWKLRQRK